MQGTRSLSVRGAGPEEPGIPSGSATAFVVGSSSWFMGFHVFSYCVNNVGREATPWLFLLVLWLEYRLAESVFPGSFNSPFRLYQVGKPVHQPSTLA
jgi:hypothetical protein